MENTSFQSRIGASQNCVCLVMLIWFVFSLGHPVVVSQPTVVQLQPQGILNSHPVINVDGGTSPVGTVPVRILTPANSSIMNEKVSVTNAIISTGINNKKQDVSFTFLIVFFFASAMYLPGYFLQLLTFLCRWILQIAYIVHAQIEVMWLFRLNLLKKKPQPPMSLH